jgi:hypothetical protein
MSYRGNYDEVDKFDKNTGNDKGDNFAEITGNDKGDNFAEITVNNAEGRQGKPAAATQGKPAAATQGNPAEMQGTPEGMQVKTKKKKKLVIGYEHSYGY